jgi:hypothetical protein
VAVTDAQDELDAVTRAKDPRGARQARLTKSNGAPQPKPGKRGLPRTTPRVRNAEPVTTDRVLECLRNFPPQIASVPLLVVRLGCSAGTLKKRLVTLQSEGRVLQVGKGRATKWQVVAESVGPAAATEVAEQKGTLWQAEDQEFSEVEESD